MDRRAVRSAPQDQEFQLVEILAVDDAAELVVAVGHLDHPSARFLEHALDGGDHLLEGNARFRQQRRKDLHLILLFEAADRGDLGHAGDRLQRRLDLAFVQQPQLTQIVRALRDRSGRTDRSSPCCWRWVRA